MGAKKAIKTMMNNLIDICGEDDAGLLLAIMCDSLYNFVKDSPEGRDARTIEIKFNDFFSTKYSWATGKYTINGIEEE